MSEARIQVKKHVKSGLLIAMSDDIDGFFVHAHTDEELVEKIGPAFESYMKAIGQPVSNVKVVKEESPEGFWPPAFIAIHQLDKKAA